MMHKKAEHQKIKTADEKDKKIDMSISSTSWLIYFIIVESLFLKMRSLRKTKRQKYIGSHLGVARIKVSKSINSLALLVN